MSASLVAVIKADLIARGIIPDPQTTNEHAGEIIVRVAFVTGGKLIAKTPGQNSCVIRGVRFSHDSIAYPDGWIDCLAGAGPPDNENRPVWNPTGRSTAALIEPFDLDAAVPDPVKPPPDVTDPQPVGLTARLVAIEKLLDTCRLELGDVKGKLDQIAKKQDRTLRGPFGWTFKP